ncbi:MAG TPA: hypothetical protein VFG75_05675 [Gaiella sp.]|nr:hypothetical protein [Gaiella sp.]
MPIYMAMGATPEPADTAAARGRSGLIGTLVAGIAFFDAVVLGAPIAVAAAVLGRPLLVFGVAAVVIVVLVVGCCRWLDHRWDAWFTRNGARLERSLESMRSSRLLKHPVAWIQRGSERSYAFAAAVANPILVAVFARSLSGEPVGERKQLLGAVAYAIPYAAMWTLIGFALAGAFNAA